MELIKFIQILADLYQVTSQDKPKYTCLVFLYAGGPNLDTVSPV